MRKTTNYGLSLYDKEDKMIITANENSLNANMEIIDKTLKDNNVPSHVKAITQEDINKWNSGGASDITVGTFIDYDKNVKAINHRGYNALAPENTLPAYILSKQKGYNYAEADVSFTSDGIAVLLHDSTIDRTSDGTGNISGFTYEELLQYDFGSWFSSDFAGTKIPTFEEFISLCKKIMLHPYIELKSTGGFTQEKINTLVDIVNSKGMKDKVTWISYSSNYLGFVKTADTSARLGFLADPTSEEKAASVVETIQSLQTENNEVFADCAIAYLNDAKLQYFINANIPVEVYLISTNETAVKNKILSSNDYITGWTTDVCVAGKVLYEKNMIDVLPEDTEDTNIPATGISLNKSSLEFTSTTSQTLIATVQPSNTTDKVTWVSNNNGVAIVSNGVVSPISNGSCTITAKAGNYSATCSVTVNIEQQEETTTYTVTNNLTNVTSSNNVTSIMEGSAYNTTLSANSGYTLGTVIVTMSGSDITSSAYSNGVVNISNVTGNIIITANATQNSTGGETDEEEIEGRLIHSWDFTQGLNDLVGNATAETSNATQDATGVTLNSASSYVKLCDDMRDGDIILVKIAECDAQMGSKHGRFVMMPDYEGTWGDRVGTGIIFRNNGNWDMYMGTSWQGTTLSKDSNLTGKTMKIKANKGAYEVYVDNVLVTQSDYDRVNPYLQLGSGQTSFYNITVSSVKMYRP